MTKIWIPPSLDNELILPSYTIQTNMSISKDTMDTMAMAMASTMNSSSTAATSGTAVTVNAETIKAIKEALDSEMSNATSALFQTPKEVDEWEVAERKLSRLCIDCGNRKPMLGSEKCWSCKYNGSLAANMADMGSYSYQDAKMTAEEFKVNFCGTWDSSVANCTSSVLKISNTDT